MDNLIIKEINKGNLINNLKVIKNKIGNKKFCVVIKANAYGIGIKNIQPLISSFADYYAVANLKEGIELRNLDSKKPILILGHTPLSQIDYAIKYNLILSIPSKQYILDLIQLSKDLNLSSLSFHLQVNTGLNRFGVRPNEIKSIKKLCVKNNLNIIGIYTHFATKSKDLDYIDYQLSNFEEVKKLWGDGVIYHCSNSYATLNKDISMEQMVRVGFSLYGMECNSFGLKPILSIKAKVVNILTLNKGETLGYDRTFKANKKTKIAVVSIGYADGFSRRLSNNFKLYIKGKEACVVGRVCMDVCFLDVTGMNVNILDDVEILGNHINLECYANALNTSDYEVLLGFNSIRAEVVII